MTHTDLSTEQLHQLLDTSISAALNAHAPYSGYKVGACLLLTDGSVVQGCNVENCAYPDGNCAEKTAICRAVAQGRKDFVALAVSTPCSPDDPNEFPKMCGSCRQVVIEFTSDQFPVYLVRQCDRRFEKRLMGDYLPGAFSPRDLDKPKN